MLARAPRLGSTSSGPRGRVHELRPATDFGAVISHARRKIFGTLTAKLFRQFTYMYIIASRLLPPMTDCGPSFMGKNTEEVSLTRRLAADRLLVFVLRPPYHRVPRRLGGRPRALSGRSLRRFWARSWARSSGRSWGRSWGRSRGLLGRPSK